jgi:hypothetical protein
MRPNPILEVVWQVKDQLAREADYDVHQFFENLRSWSKEHPHVGAGVQTAEETAERFAPSRCLGFQSMGLLSKR